MTTVSLSPPNAILFVFDPSHGDVRVPEYIEGRLTAGNETCVSVGTRAEVDGETVVSLGRRRDAGDLTKLEKVFEGRVETPGRKIAVVTSEFQPILHLAVPDSAAKISIWVDDNRNPGRISVLVE